MPPELVVYVGFFGDELFLCLAVDEVDLKTQLAQMELAEQAELDGYDIFEEEFMIVYRIFPNDMMGRGLWLDGSPALTYDPI